MFEFHKNIFPTYINIAPTAPTQTMAQTRFFDDDARIAAALELQTQCGRYMLNAPGPGEDLPFMEDAHCRLQRWGANLDRFSLEVENELHGMNRPAVTKDAFVHVFENMPRATANGIGSAFASRYPTARPYTDESRSTHPAWAYRSMDDTRTFACPPFLNPQAPQATELQFPAHIQTRILEKDAYEGAASGAAGAR